MPTTTYNPDFWTEHRGTRRFVLVDNDTMSYSPLMYLTSREQRIINDYCNDKAENMCLVPYPDPLSKEWVMGFWQEAFEFESETETE